MEFQLIKQPRVFPEYTVYRIEKRFMDIAICLIALPFALPLMLLCVFAIWLDSSGSILLTQPRMGKGGRQFRMYKFRTMKANLDNRHCESYMKAYVRGDISESADGTKIFKGIQADEITRLGHVLRKLSLDELPQIFNVLKGDMSIVGPRPNVIWEFDAYYPWHHERLEVLPGITGLAQVRGRSCIDFASLVRYDIEYIENKCISLDFKILWWTFTSILRGKGAM